MQKKKTASITTRIINAGGEVAKRNLLLEQESIFHDYENELTFLRKQLSDLGQKMKDQLQHSQTSQVQLHHKNAGYNRKMQEAIGLRNENTALRDQIDSLSMRVLEAEQSKEERVKYYTNLVKGLTSTAANAEEASFLMRFLHKSLIDYQSGQKVEDLVYKTEKMCSICLSEPANIVAKPCHHLEWCRGCAIEQFKLSEQAFDVIKSEFISDKQLCCPRCKQDVDCLDYSSYKSKHIKKITDECVYTSDSSFRSFFHVPYYNLY